MLLNCSSKENAATYDLVRHAASSTKVQHESCNTEAPRLHEKTGIQRESTESRGVNVNNIGSNWRWSIKSSQKKAWYYWSRSLANSMPLWQQQLQSPAQSSSPLSWIQNAPLCRFCFVTSNPTTQFPAIPGPLGVTLINKHETNLPSLARCPWMYPSKSHRIWSPLRYGSTVRTQRSMKASIMHLRFNQNPWEFHLCLTHLPHRFPPKRKEKIQRKVPFAPVDRTTNDVLLYLTQSALFMTLPTQKSSVEFTQTNPIHTAKQTWLRKQAFGYCRQPGCTFFKYRLAMVRRTWRGFSEKWLIASTFQKDLQQTTSWSWQAYSFRALAPIYSTNIPFCVPEITPSSRSHRRKFKERTTRLWTKKPLRHCS